MLIYVLFWIIIFLLSFKIEKKKFSIYDLILLVIIILFSGLRACGTDYALYSRIFSNLNSIESRTGIGFSYLIYFIKYTLHFDFQFLVFLCAAITNLCIYYFIKKNSEKPGLAMLIYISAGFYTTSFNMFRQSLSIALILLSSQLIDEKKFLRVTILWIIAFSIHSSSIIAIIIYSIMKFFKRKRIQFKYLLAASIIGLLLYDKLFIYLITMLKSYSMYSLYNSIPGVGTYINVFVYLFITIFLIIPNYKSNKLKKQKELINYNNYNLFLIGVMIMVMELKNFLFFRIAFYFTILGPIILTEFYVEHNIKKRKLENIIFYLCLLIYFMVYVFSFDGVLPYKTYF